MNHWLWWYVRSILGRAEMRINRILLVGYASVDIVIAPSSASATLNIGGVCTNVARVLGTLKVPTTYVTPSYHAQFARWLELELADYSVEWCRLDTGGPPAIFLARLDPSGQLASDEFIDSGVCAGTDVNSVEKVVRDIGSDALLMSCTDVPLSELRRLHNFARARSISFGLVSTSDEEVDKLGSLGESLNFLSINLRELELFLGHPIADEQGAANGVRQLLIQGGAALVTMGDRGALLVDKSPNNNIWLQSVPRLSVANTLGAGDVMTGALLAGIASSQSWPEALAFATSVVLSYLSRDESCSRPQWAVHSAYKGELEAIRRIK
jgi:sugar/nucleoside kinase (ribokinase family)